MARPLAVLTGATGFLGGWLTRALHAAGYDLRVLVRRDPGPDAWGEARPAVVIGALDNDGALEALLQGASLVIHAAGLIKARNRRAFFEVNEGGSRRMAEAMLRCAPKARFVHISSIVARHPELSSYAASKRAGEAAVSAMLPAERLTIVRPPAIYGPGDLETLSLFRAARWAPVLPLPGSSHARIALIHVADAAAQIAAIAAQSSNGSTFTLSDARPEGYRWREIMQAASAAVGRSPGLIPAPAALILALGALGGGFGGLAGSAAILTMGKARELLHPDWAVSSQEIAPGLPRCRFDIVDGFADTVAWARAAGRL